MSNSFLASGEFTLGEIRWGNDDCGDFWSATYYNKDTGKQLGITGTYYNLNENDKRDSREDQEAEIRAWGLL